MAVGDGGFKQVAFGFDKNEVNTYISDLRKKTKAMEDEMKASQRKAEEAVKLADQADERIKEAVKEVQDKADEIQAKLDAEEKKTADLEKKIADLKAELEKERKNMTDMLKSGKGVSAEAQKAYTEIINKANADADDIIAAANEKAEAIVSDANSRCADTNEKTTAFLELFRTQLEAFGENYKTIAESAADMLGTAAIAAPVVELPKAEIPAPVVEIAKEEPVVEAEPEEEAPTVEEIVSEPTPEPEPEPEVSSDEPASFDEVWGGGEIAEAIAQEEKKESVPLVNPDFGKDVFGLGTAAEEDVSLDLNAAFEQPAEDTIDDIKPLDVSEHADASYDNSFDTDLLSQTMSSSSLGSDVSDDLLAAVKAAEESFAVKPTNSADFDMDEDNVSSALDPEDELMKALREAEEALNSINPEANMSDDTPVQESAPAGDDPWADLQKQLEAMEQSGITGDVVAETVPSEPETPAAPSADDASIWDFGGSSSSSDSDDDMSSDFGGFGGF